MEYTISDFCRIPPNPGSIVREVHAYRLADQHGIAGLRELNLSSRTRGTLKVIKSHEGVQHMLEKFGVSFPVFIDHLKTSHLIHLKYLDKVGKHRLNQIHEVWGEITQGNPNLGKALDIKTVNLLEAMLPTVKEDRDHIIDHMEGLFPDIKDKKLRHDILETILQLRAVIPTVDSFLEDAGDFQVAMKVLRVVILPRVPNIREGKQPPTMRDQMAKYWTQPSEPMIEISEGKFRRTNKIGVDLAYKQVLISILRQIDRFVPHDPTVAPDPTYKNLLLKRANILGFSTRKIMKGLAEQEGKIRLTADDMERGEPRKSKRRAVGCTDELRRQLFLPLIFNHHSLSKEEIIQREFIDSFLGLDEECKRAIEGLQEEIVSFIDEREEVISSSRTESITESTEGIAESTAGITGSTEGIIVSTDNVTTMSTKDITVSTEGVTQVEPSRIAAVLGSANSPLQGRGDERREPHWNRQTIIVSPAPPLRRSLRPPQVRRPGLLAPYPEIRPVIQRRLRPRPGLGLGTVTKRPGVPLGNPDKRRKIGWDRSEPRRRPGLPLGNQYKRNIKWDRSEPKRRPTPPWPGIKFPPFVTVIKDGAKIPFGKLKSLSFDHEWVVYCKNDRGSVTVKPIVKELVWERGCHYVVLEKDYFDKNPNWIEELDTAI